jgi:hypothetical protein
MVGQRPKVEESRIVLLRSVRTHRIGLNCQEPWFRLTAHGIVSILPARGKSSDQSGVIVLAPAGSTTSCLACSAEY